MTGAFDPKYRVNKPQSSLRIRDRFSINVLVERSGVSGALIICVLALLFLFFALTEFALAAPLGVALQSSGESGVRFSCATDKGEQSLLVAIPQGARPVLVSATPQGAKTLAPAELARAVATSTIGPLVEIKPAKLVRGWLVAPVIVRGVGNNLAYESVDVEIRFEQDPAFQFSGSAPAALGAFEEIFAATVVNYTQAKSWNSGSRLSRSSAAPLPSAAFSYTSDWLKLTVRDQGLVRLNGSDIGAPLNSSSVRVFYGGGEPLPPYNTAPRPALEEIPLLVFDGGDGVFNANDYLLFYGETANRWRFPADSAPMFVRNVYTNDNYYWLTTDGGFPDPALRMTALDGSVTGGAPALNSGRALARLESEELLSRNSRDDIDNFYDWFWTSATQHQITFTAPAPLTDPSQDDTTRFAVHAIAGAVNLTVNGAPAVEMFDPPQESWSFFGPPLQSGSNSLDFALSRFFSRGPYFDFVEVSYLTQLALRSGEVEMYFPGRDGRAELRINSGGSALITLNVDNPRAPQQITGGEFAAGQWRVEAQLNAASPNRYFTAELSSARAPAVIGARRTTDLVSDTSAQVDYLVIGPAALEVALDRYLSYREQRSNVTARFVALEDIYDNFSFGGVDPTAIRDFLKYTFERYPAPAPSVALFVGDGTYDLRAITSNSGDNIFPPYIRPGRFERDYISDDSYVYFDDFAFLDSDGDHVEGVTYGVDMVPARWPVKNLGELNTVIDKIIAYESTPDLGPWRNKVTLLADDEFGEFIDEAVHVQQTEDLERFHLPSQYMRDKIYLWDYPLNSLQERPTVNEALVRTLNEGSLILNYVGHGNPSLFAHERVFTNQSDLPRLRNGARLPVVFTASCSIGFFDDPNTEGMAERLVRMEGGAILVVSATRLVYSQANALFNRVAYDHIFGPQNLTVAQAVFAAKMTRADAQGTKGNDRRYAIFGDPWLRLGTPAYEVEYTSAPDTLVALTPAVIAGRVVDEFGAPVAGFNGTAQVVVYDTRATRNHKVLNNDGDVRADVYYDVNGAALYRGSAPVVNGEFSVTFVPSLDVGFGGVAARISAYASDKFSDAIGVIDSLPISATVPSTTDNSGPEISLVLPERSGFVSGDPVGPSEEIIVRLSDTSGINLGAGFGHGITLMIDNEITNELTLSESFVYDPGSFRSGSASVTLPNLAPGPHTFRIKAWDNANNSASLTFTAQVTLQTALSIDQLLNYPNPVQETTAFYFTLMAPVTRMSLEIFTVSGIKVHEAEERDLPQGYNEGRFVWDGRDQDGDRVATGVYVYRAVAHPADPGKPVEEFGKLIVVN